MSTARVRFLAALTLLSVAPASALAAADDCAAVTGSESSVLQCLAQSYPQRYEWIEDYCLRRRDATETLTQCRQSMWSSLDIKIPILRPDDVGSVGATAGSSQHATQTRVECVNSDVVPYSKLGSPAFAEEFDGKCVTFTAEFRGEFTAVPALSNYGAPTEGFVFLNHRAPDYEEEPVAGMPGVSTDANLPSFILAVPKAKSGFVFEWARGQKFQASGRATVYSRHFATSAGSTFDNTTLFVLVDTAQPISASNAAPVIGAAELSSSDASASAHSSTTATLVIGDDQIVLGASADALISKYGCKPVSGVPNDYSCQATVPLRLTVAADGSISAVEVSGDSMWADRIQRIDDANTSTLGSPTSEEQDGADCPESTRFYKAVSLAVTRSFGCYDEEDPTLSIRFYLSTGSPR